MVHEDFIDINASTGSVGRSENNELFNSTCDLSELNPQPSGSQGREEIINEQYQGREDIINEENQGGEDCITEENQGGEDCITEENQGREDIVTEENPGTEDILNDEEEVREGIINEENQGREKIINEEKSEQGQCDGGSMDGQQIQHDIEHDEDSVEKPLILMESIKLDETVITTEKLRVNSLANKRNGFATGQNDNDISNHEIYDRRVKRARSTYADQQPSVRVTYNSLTSASKRKLEKLLQQWSEWNAKQDSSINKPHEALVSGEETYFPALCVGLEKAAAVSFWMDNETKKEQNKEIIRMDSDSAPLYDRGYSLGLTLMDGLTNVEGGLETLEASRCFNCGSYNHALKECPKTRDNVAVNNARKQHNSKRNQNSGPHKMTRYYQNSSGGKYDGLQPGFLGLETRQLLGIKEFDPPPWLQRMREIGYPPGYMDSDDEDRDSGIKIYLDEKIKEDQEDGELSETDEPEQPESKKNMSVEFPGINAPIPENADERHWASLQGVPNFDPYKKRISPSSSLSLEANYRGNYSEQRRSRNYRDDNHFSEQRLSRDYKDDGHYREKRQSRDYRDDDHPRCDPEAGQSMSTFISSYSDHNSGYVRSLNLGRSISDRERWSPSVYEDSPNQSRRNSLHHSTSDSRRGSSGRKQQKRRFAE